MNMNMCIFLILVTLHIKISNSIRLTRFADKAKSKFVNEPRQHLNTDGLSSDHFSACSFDNEMMGLGHETMLSHSRKLGVDSLDKNPTPIAKFDLAKWGPPKHHPNLAAASGPRGKNAVSTNVVLLGSSRFDIPGGKSDDLLRCSLLLQFLSLKEFGGFRFDDTDQVDYVILHSNVGDEDLKFWNEWGIKTKEVAVFNTTAYHDSFRAGAMARVHAAGLTEYSRVATIDGDMYARSDLKSLFLQEFEEDMISDAGDSSPISGNYIILRPDDKAYELIKDIALDNYKFNYARGWNPDDPRSGLFTWPLPPEFLPCDMKHGGHLMNGIDCDVTEDWKARCKKDHVTNWNWMGASEVQGIFAYVYNISGYGTARWLGVYENEYPRQGLPWWWHFQGGCKPHLSARLPKAEQEKMGCDAVHEKNVWFWNMLWGTVRQKYPSIIDVCPSFESAAQKFAEDYPER